MKRMIKMVALLMAALMVVTSCQAPDSGSQLTSETVDVSFAGPSARTITTDDGLVQTIPTSDLWFQYKAVWQGEDPIPSTATNEWTSLPGPGLSSTVKLHRGRWNLSLRAFVNQSDVDSDDKFILSGTREGVEIGTNNMVTQTVSINLGYVRQEGNGTLHVSATYPVVYREGANPESPVEAVRKVKVTANVSGTDYTGEITTFDSNNVGVLDLTVPAGAAHVTVQYYMDENTLFEGDQAAKDVLIMATMTTNLAVSVDRDITSVTFTAEQPSGTVEDNLIKATSLFDIYPDTIGDEEFVIGYAVETKALGDPIPITYPYISEITASKDEKGRYKASDLGLVPITVPDDSALEDSYATEAWMGKNASLGFNETALVAVRIVDGATRITDISDCWYLKSIYIPDTVETIDSSAFEYDEALESIVIPDSVTSLGTYAFDACSSLKSVKIGNGVTLIDDRTFHDCESLESVTLGNSVERINYEAFNGCSNLKSINFPESLKYIDQGVFAGCNFSSVMLPEGLEEIEDDAFKYCPNLTSVTIPDTVTYIGEAAFASCDKLVSVTIGKGVNDMHSRAFQKNPSLESITVNEENVTYGSIDGVLINKIESEILQYPAAKQDEIYTVPGSITSLGGEAFMDAVNLREIIIPSTVTSGGVYGCNSLRTATLSDGATTVSYMMFNSCKNLMTVNLPGSVTSIGEKAFQGCDALTEINVAGSNSSYASVDGVLFNKGMTTILVYPAGKNVGNYNIPDGIKTIGNYAFDHCTNLTNVNIPDSVTYIGNYAFYYANGLTGITIPSSVTSIGEHAFYGCAGLSSITIPASITSFGGYVFDYCKNLADVTIQEGATTIGNSMFSSCNALTDITIPNTVTSIGQYAFQNCTGLTNITIPASVKTIGRNAFDGCTGLTSVSIPEGVKTIGTSAFSECYNLTSITIPSSVTSVGSHAFWCCYDLKDIYVNQPESTLLANANIPQGYTVHWNSTGPGTV